MKKRRKHSIREKTVDLFRLLSYHFLGPIKIVFNCCEHLLIVAFFSSDKFELVLGIVVCCCFCCWFCLFWLGWLVFCGGFRWGGQIDDGCDKTRFQSKMEGSQKQSERERKVVLRWLNRWKISGWLAVYFLFNRAPPNELFSVSRSDHGNDIMTIHYCANLSCVMTRRSSVTDKLYLFFT